MKKSAWRDALIVTGLSYVAYKLLNSEPSMESPSDTMCIVISGCDTGFGQLTSLKLAKAGYTVFAGCLTEQGRRDLEQSQSECQGRLIPLLLNVASLENVKEFVAQVEADPDVEQFGIFCLINNAGVNKGFILECTTDEEFLDTMQVNFLGAVRLMRELLPLLRRYNTVNLKRMVRERDPRIVNITSCAGRIPSSPIGAYSASKFALEAATVVMRTELSRFNIHVTAIEPWFSSTPIVTSARNVLRDRLTALSPELRKLYEIDKDENYLKILAGQEVPPPPGTLDPQQVVDVIAKHATCTGKAPNQEVVGTLGKLVVNILPLLPSFLQPGRR